MRVKTPLSPGEHRPLPAPAPRPPRSRTLRYPALPAPHPDLPPPAPAPFAAVMLPAPAPSSVGCRASAERKPVTSAPSAPHSRAANVDHDDRPARGRLPDAMEPGIHCARTHWIRGFMAFQLVRCARIVVLMVPVCPESGFLGRAARAGPPANGIELSGPPALRRTPCPRLAGRPPALRRTSVPRLADAGWMARR
jgi:hypothetical protein